jgi:hypothetical protein
MRKASFIAVALASLGLIAAACSSSPSTTSGTEHFSGIMTGKAALANNVSFPLKFTGPVTATGTFSTSGPAPKVGQHHTFKTSSGNLVAVVTAVPQSGNGPPTPVNMAKCQFASGTKVTFKVVPGESTGKFAGATGTGGKVNAQFTATLPKLSNGHCNESNSAQPTAASFSFTGAVPLTVKS